jgi:hypothetical protein
MWGVLERFRIDREAEEQRFDSDGDVSTLERDCRVMKWIWDWEIDVRAAVMEGFKV